MSLLDALLRDSLLNTVVQSDVYIAIRTDGAPGAGTEEDPYNGGKLLPTLDTDKPPVVLANATTFDTLMNALPAGVTIRLGSGIFCTRGYPASTGWKPKSGQRIVGSGMDATTLLVCNGQASARTVAIGVDLSTVFLQGFEASDLTIDCALSYSYSGHNANASVGGVAVTGTHVFLRRIRLKNFGNQGTGVACYGLSAATAYQPNHPYNCLIEECLVQEPGGANSNPVVCLHVGSATGTGILSYHTACAIRNCWVDCSDATFTKEYQAISAMFGKGTIVEGNRIYNCKNGGPYYDGTEGDLPTTVQAVTDLVVRDNYYYNVHFGVFISTNASSGNVGRVIIQKNVFELGQATSAPAAVTLFGGNRSSPPGFFAQLILRGNLIRPVDGAAPSASTLGITLNSVDEAVVESNVINVATSDKALSHTVCGSVKPFNNQSSAGVFLPGYDGTAFVHDPELTTDVQDVLLEL